jgi:uncharacterized protein (TIGR03083 family)
MSDQDNSARKLSKAELLERIHHSYSRLEETLHPLSENQLTRPSPSGWAIKDHLSHLAAWELGVAELLQRRSRFAAMRVEEAVAQGKSEDEINDLIYRLYAQLSPAQAREKLREAHRQMLQALEGLSDDDLYRPYTAYLPQGSSGPEQPVMNWIVGDTFEHFDEHNGYIRDFLASAGKES